MKAPSGIAHEQRGRVVALAPLGQSSWWMAGRNLVFGLAVVAGLWLTVTPTDISARWVQFALAGAAVVGMLFSRRLPGLAVFVTAATTGTAWLLGVTADPFVLTGFAVFAVAERHGTRRFPWWMFVGVAVVLCLSMGLGAEGLEDRFRGMLLSVVVLATAWVLGVRTRQATEAAAARSRAEERLRLARDVHDVLSHSLGSIGVRAGVAAHVATLSEDELRDVLRGVEHDARGSLAELKGLLQRERGVHDAAAGIALSSSPLTEALADVARSAEGAGVRVRVDTDGDMDGLPVSVRTTVYRLVQEAVTNTIRHASASSLTIAVSAFEDRLRVEVRDDGRGAAPEFREGHGLTGMRERVALLGGTLRLDTAEPGFAVIATMPLPTSVGGSVL